MFCICIHTAESEAENEADCELAAAAKSTLPAGFALGVVVPEGRVGEGEIKWESKLQYQKFNSISLMWTAIHQGDCRLSFTCNLQQTQDQFSEAKRLGCWCPPMTRTLVDKKVLALLVASEVM